MFTPEQHNQFVTWLFDWLMAVPIAIASGFIYLVYGLSGHDVSDKKATRKLWALVLLSMGVGFMAYTVFVGLGMSPRMAGGIATCIGSMGSSGYKLMHRVATEWIPKK